MVGICRPLTTRPRRHSWSPEPEQLRALADELRGRIVSLLREHAWSTQQLAGELGLPKGTVGHHLKVLERAGLIRVVHTRKVRAMTEKFYGRVARLFLFQAEDPADVRAFGAATLRDAAFQLERAPEGAGWGLVLSPAEPKEIARFDRRLEKLLEDFRHRGRRRRHGAPARARVLADEKPDA